ncbi:unnamed protein product [Closterium sp. NIES-54]
MRGHGEAGQAGRGEGTWGGPSGPGCIASTVGCKQTCSDAVLVVSTHLSVRPAIARHVACALCPSPSRSSCALPQPVASPVRPALARRVARAPCPSPLRRPCALPQPAPTPVCLAPACRVAREEQRAPLQCSVLQRAGQRAP